MVKDFLKAMLPVDVLRMVYLIFLSPIKFFDKVTAKRWSNISHPIPFFIGATGLALIIPLGSSFYETQLSWFEIFEGLNEKDQIEFYIAFDAIPEDPRHMWVMELFQPGSTSYSKRIEEFVNSLDPLNVSNYLATKNPDLAKSFVAQYRGIEKLKKIENIIVIALWPIMLLFASATANRIIANQAISITNTLNVTLYFHGFWLLLCFTIISAGHRWVPLHGPIALAFIIFEFVVTVIIIVHLYAVFRYTHDRGFWRLTGAFFSAAIVWLCLAVALSVTEYFIVG